MNNMPDSTENGTNEKQVLSEKNGGHIMISYNWSHQKELMKIRNILQKKRLPVWMDVENMRGAKYQAMAEGVQNARVVLVCYSRKYKDSSNCRSEAEYAADKRKTIIPLKMEKRYEPDGWLALLIAGKIFIDFSAKYSFKNQMEKLCKQLASSFESQTMRKTPTIRKQAEDVDDGGPPPKESVASLRKWTSTAVENWIQRNHLPKQEFGRLTGRDLAGLFIMRTEAPECFYTRLKTDLKIESFATTDMLIEALDEFTN